MPPETDPANSPKPNFTGPAALHNETPNRLVLMGDHGNVLTLAPLETTQPLDPTTLNEFSLQPLAQRNLLRWLKTEPQGKFDSILGSVRGIAFWFVVLGIIFSVFRRPWVGWYWAIGSGAICFAFIVTLLAAKKLGNTIVQVINEGLSVVFVLIFGIGMPAAAIYWFGSGSQLFTLLPPYTLLLLGRILQFVFILAASVLPAGLYFLFDRQCSGTLRSRFERAIFRLDPSVSTLTDVRAKYGQQMREVYGPEDGPRSKVRLNPRATPVPMIAATILIALGWLITLTPVGDVNVEEPGRLLFLFVPQASAITFGFLGAYFFSVNDVLRRYVRRDLKTKAYSGICVRILIVTILAWVISSLPKVTDGTSGKTSSLALALIFMVGIFPETGLTYIREALRPLTGKLLSLMEEKSPLTDLDGVDLYDRTRLLDEGVTNIEALAHHDFVDLMMETRIPVPRLVDWVDQAILYLHVRSSNDNGESDLRLHLRNYGIRTATDLMLVYQLSQTTGQLDAVLQTLSGDTDVGKVNRLQIVVDALSDDEWLDCIRHWRLNTPAEPVVLKAGIENCASPAELAVV